MLLRWQEGNLGERAVVVDRLAPGTAVFEPLGRLGADADRFSDRYHLLPGVYTYRVKPVGTDTDAPYAMLTVRFPKLEVSPVYLPATYMVRRR